MKQQDLELDVGLQIHPLKQGLSNIQLRSILEALPAYVAYLDTNGTYQYVNKTYEVIFGKPQSAFIGNNYKEYLEGDEGEKRRALVERAFQGEPTCYRGEAVIRGEPVPLLANYVPDRDADGNVVGVIILAQDLTALKNAEKAFEISEARFQTLFEESPLAMQLFNQDGYCTSVNKAFENLWKIPKESLKNYCVFKDRQLKALGISPIIESAFNGQITSAPVVYFEPEKSGLKGMGRWVQVYVYPVKSLLKKEREVAVVIEDVSERIAALGLEKRLAAQAQFLSEASRVLFSSLDYRSTLAKVSSLAISTLAEWCVVYMPDRNGKLQAISISHKDSDKVKYARKIRDKHPIDISGSNSVSKAFRTGSSKLYKDVPADLLEQMNLNIDHFGMHKRLGLRSGMIVPLKIRDRVLGVMTFVISEGDKRFDESDLFTAEELSKRAAIAIENASVFEEAEKERSKFEGFLREAPTLIVATRGPEFLIEMTSKHIIFSERGGEKLNGQPLEQVIPELREQGFIDSMQEVFTSKKPAFLKEHSLVFHLKGGKKEYFFNTVIQPIFGLQNQVTGIICHSLDVTELVVSRKRIEELAVAARSASEAKTLFLANMSHEIRTPLGAILGFTELLRDKKLSDEERDEYMDIISKNGKALTQIINDVLDLSKVEAGRIKFEKKRFTVRDLISEVLTVFQAAVEGKGLYLYVEWGRGVPEAIVSDPARLRQILINILGNAVKFTDEGGVRLRIEASSENQILIYVTDTGIGIPIDQKGRLFQPFNQADNSMTRRYGGTGLGLVLSRKLARALGGDVTLESCENGKGCTFLVKFNYELPEGNERVRSNNTTLTSLKEYELNDINVLVVDDSPDNRLLVQRILENRGAKVSCCENGQLGAEAALNGQFDVVLMDVQMPVLDGNRATMLLRSRGYQKPIIALTAHAMKEDRERSIKAGCNYHLSKPVIPKELVQVVKDYSLRAKSN